VASLGSLLDVAEGEARCVQVFREFAFLFAFRLTLAGGEALEPSALAPLDKGRVLVACRAPQSGLFLVDGAGRLLRELVGEGEEEGRVHEPSDIVLEQGTSDSKTYVYVIDDSGGRVQAFTLEGQSQGSFRVNPSTPAREKRVKKKGGR
jgi:hypothetical protein